MPECAKCGYPDCGLSETGPIGPWCERCRKKFPEEYLPILQDWVLKHAGALLSVMNVPAAYRGCRFENFEANTADQRRVKDAVQRWIDEAESGLFLCGGCGTGKTHLAVSALLAFLARGCRGRFVSVQELLTECRDSFRNDRGLDEILEHVYGASLLLLDDLGTENPTNFARETLALVIDRAYRDQQTIIITSNYDFEALVERLDVRSVDRLIEICLAVKFTGQSYRQRLARQRANLKTVP